MKFVLFDMAVESGVDLWLHSGFIDSIVDANWLCGIQAHNKSGLRCALREQNAIV